MTISTTSQKAQTAFQKELAEFGKQSARLGNCLLNKVFDLTVKGSQRRNQMLVTLFLASGVIFTLAVHSLDTWLAEIGNLFQYFFNAAYAQQHPETFTQFFYFTFGAVLSPRTLRYLPVFVLPFILALQSAAIYLADIFELSDIKVAREFILQVALRGGRENLHIKNGDVVEKDRNSPIFLIGGPGKVLVELDSVALFEKPDGKPHIIDSTKASNTILDGFERFRGAIDLRDQFLELSEKENNSVKGRSLDGMEIKATDVRLLYRIHRDNLNPTLERPHPYVKDAVYHLIYNEGRPVTSEGIALQTTQSSREVYQRSPTGLQMGAIESLIRGELGKFMRKHKLTRYLASYGLPEYENASEREEAIKNIRNLVADPHDPAEDQEVSPPPEFESRVKITSLFTEFTSDFRKNAMNSGVDLHWIGVGTWKPPNEIIIEKHIEAWRISLENLSKGSQSAMENLGKDTKIQEKIHLVQDVPLARFREDRASGKDHKYIVQNLLVAYREQLVKIKELLEGSQLTVPVEILWAIDHIDDVLGIKWVGRSNVSPSSGAPQTPPASGAPGAAPMPSTAPPPTSPIPPDEEGAYQYLVLVTGHDTDRADRLIEYERRFAPRANRKELIQRAIERLMRENQ